jgi:tetratricopeptide (TPR) repeat protein
MSDNDTSSANTVVSGDKGLNKRFTPLTIVVFVAILLIIIVLISRFAVDRSRTNKVKTALASAQIDNAHNLPNMALGQLNQISGIKLNTSDQLDVLMDKVSSYSELGEYAASIENAEQAYKLAPGNISLLTTIAEQAQSNNQTQIAITYYQKLITAMGNIPNGKRSITYNADLAQVQAQLKELSNQ